MRKEHLVLKCNAQYSAAVLLVLVVPVVPACCSFMVQEPSMQKKKYPKELIVSKASDYFGGILKHAKES